MSTRDALLVGKGLPGYVLRGAVLAVGFVIVLVPLSEGTTVGTLFVLAPSVVAAAYAPASPVPAVVIVVAAVLAALADGDPLRVQVLVLIPLVHLFHVLCGIAGVVPAAGRLHLRALRSPALRFVLVQAVVFVLVLASSVLPTGRTPALFEVVGLVGLTGLAVLVLWLQRVK